MTTLLLCYLISLFVSLTCFYTLYFFITLSYNAIHNPYQALKSDYDKIKFNPEYEYNHNYDYIHNQKVYLSMIKAVDRGIGNILKSLKSTNQLDNTLIILTSDNGGTHIPNLNYINEEERESII